MNPEHRMATREELLDSINKLVLEKQVAIEALENISKRASPVGEHFAVNVAILALEKLRRL